MSILEEVKGLERDVSSLLSSYEQLRDDDVLLYLAVLNTKHKLKDRIGKDAYCVLKTILTKEAPKLVSVTRVRAKIQSEGKFLGKRRLDRLKEASKMRSYFRGE
jgi:hypothetical protein